MDKRLRSQPATRADSAWPTFCGHTQYALVYADRQGRNNEFCVTVSTKIKIDVLAVAVKDDDCYPAPVDVRYVSFSGCDPCCWLKAPEGYELPHKCWYACMNFLLLLHYVNFYRLSSLMLSIARFLFFSFAICFSSAFFSCFWGYPCWVGLCNHLNSADSTYQLSVLLCAATSFVFLLPICETRCPHFCSPDMGLKSIARYVHQPVKI